MALDVTGRYRYPPPRSDWLAQVTEEVIDPALPIIDAHHHFWREGGTDYLLEDLLTDTRSGHNIAATVFVQAHHFYRQEGPSHLACVGETEAVMAMRKAAIERADAPGVAAAIVAYADLTLPLTELDDVISAHRSVAGSSFRAIRHSVARDDNFPEGIVLRPAPAGLLNSDAYRTGLSHLDRHGIAYEAMLYHGQISQLTETARALPGLRIILDHAGCVLGVGPYKGREDETFLSWAEDLAELARCPNVSVKIGGFGMIICGAQWHERPFPPQSAELARAWRPYVETCIASFGPQRCAFESNFPVDKGMYSYRTLWNAFKRIVEGASVEERIALFHGTAASFYNIDLPATANG